MKLPPLFCALLLIFLSGARAEEPVGYYQADIDRLFFLRIYRGDDSNLTAIAAEVNPITGQIGNAYSGSGTNKPNGIVLVTFPGKGHFRGRVNEEGGFRGRLFFRLHRNGLRFTRRVEFQYIDPRITPLPPG